jgi:hypothetical protein
VSIHRRQRGPCAGRAAVGVWAASIAVVFTVGHVLRQAGRMTEDALPPLYAQPRLLTWQILPAAALAAVAVVVLPGWARRMAWWRLLLAGWAVSVAWAVALAASDGIDALTRPLTSQNDYLAGLDDVRADPLSWLSTFTRLAQNYPVHTKGHPPLPMLVLWLLDAAGMRGPGWAAALIIAVGGSATVAITITLRNVAGEDLARRAVPFLALAPLAVWIATAMDAFFLGAGAWGTALIAIAARRGTVARAVAGGVLLGTLPYLSYGLLPLFAVPVTVLIVARPRRRVVIAVLCGMAVVPLAFTLGGFWWPDGVAATHRAYLSVGGSSRRSYAYFLVGDLAVLGLLTGPAVAHVLPATLAASWRAVTRRAPGFSAPAVVGLVAVAALVGTVALDVSGVTRGEVERIWVPYAAWLVAAAALHRPPARRMLTAQALTGLASQALVLSAW